MKTSELIGAELDYWVAKADKQDSPEIRGTQCYIVGNLPLTLMPYRPSTNWQQGGPLIEKYYVVFWHFDHGLGPWHAIASEDAEHFKERDDDDQISSGETPLIAAMRCIVASKFGDEVDD